MKYTNPDGFCKTCGLPYWKDEHDHKTLGTLSPEAALKVWRDKLAKEQEDAARAEEYAATPGQQHGNV